MNAPLPTGLQASLFGARQRLHIQHGPTDLVIDADGPYRLIPVSYTHLTLPTIHRV